MTSAVFVNNAKVMAKGQVTIPKDVRKRLGIESGDQVAFVVDGDEVRIVNSAVYAMRVLQTTMAGAAHDAGLETDEEIDALMSEIRGK